MNICNDPVKFFSSESGLSSYRIRIGFSFFDIEVRSQNPVLVKFRKILSEKEISNILQFQKNQELESMKVFGEKKDEINDARIANGNHLDKEKSNFLKIINRLQNVFKINLTTSEGLLFLKYGIGGHYAPHYDSFANNSRKDEWLINYGNRIATIFFILKPADSGGGTIFPNLNLVVQPDPGDAIFWINCDSTETVEKNSLHGSCPISDGTKIGISLWIRFRPQNLQSPVGSPSYSLYTGFQSKAYWNNIVLDHCDTKSDKYFGNQTTDPRFLCYVYHVNFLFVKAEVLSFDPPLVKLHSFFPKGMVKEFRRFSRKQKLGDLLVKSTNGPDRNVAATSRITKGLFIQHRFSDETSRAFDFIQSRIPSVNFKAAEQFQILNYKPGGHYAPHFDYLERNYDLSYRGNRMVTFMVIIKIAEIGGGTIYPKIGITFQPQPGDAVIWVNQNPDGSRSERSLHGACPVLKGEKIGLTLWAREFGQTFRYLCPLEEDRPYGIDWIIKPKWRSPEFEVQLKLPFK